MNKLRKILTSSGLIVALVVPMLALTLNFALAADGDANKFWGTENGGTDGSDATSVQGAYTTTFGEGQDPRAMVAQLINVLLGFLGTIAVVLILYGGFKWMTAAGNDENVKKAQKVLGAGVAGLVIILSAFLLSKYLIGLIYGVTSSSGT